MFVPVPVIVKKCLLATGAGMFVMALAACSQAPDAKEASVPVMSEDTAAAEVRPKKKRSRKSRATKVAEALPVETSAAESAGEPAAVESETTAATTSAPEVAQVESPAPFVPVAPGKRIANVSVPGRYVAVTFDDGPSAMLTPQVLDIFNRHGARATFFVLGRNAVNNKKLIARAVAEGHEVGSHTWSHINMQASSTEQIFSELDRTSSVIERATGSRPKVMRPPYGSTNKTLINKVYNRYGTPSILWDVDTNDWRKPGVQTVINRAVNNAKPGSIILLHDIHPSTIAAVEGVVTGLQARGFQLVTVSELIDMARRAAGVTAPAMEAEVPAAAEPASAAPAAAAAAAEPVAVPAAPAASPYSPPQLPVGSASVGVPQVAVPVAPSSAGDDFKFYES